MIDDGFALRSRRIWVAGHHGMVGSALVRRLQNEDCEILTATRSELDLRRQSEVEAWISERRPEAVILSAATVGGILANDSRPADFIYDNLQIETNIIHASHRLDIQKLLFLGSSCIYPKFAPQPITESALLTGPLEPTNQWYAIAKIAGIKLCTAYRRQYGRDFISAMPTNLYGIGDNFDLQSSHVLPALLAKMHLAKLKGDRAVTIWGTGTPRRELLYVDDCADALVFLLKNYSGDEHVNVGTGRDLSINELAELVKKIVGFEGEIEHDVRKPDGTPRKLMSVQKLADLGWTATTPLELGIMTVYAWFLENRA